MSTNKKERVKVQFTEAQLKVRMLEQLNRELAEALGVAVKQFQKTGITHDNADIYNTINNAYRKANSINQ